MPLTVEVHQDNAGVTLPVAEYGNDETWLYDAITSENWEGALEAVAANPEEAGMWVVKGENSSCRFLPLHSACARRPPGNIISALLAVYPDAASEADHQGM